MQTAARRFGAADVDRRLTFLDVLDLAFFVDVKRGAVGNPHILNEHSVSLRDLPLREIAQERERQLMLLGEFLERRAGV